MNKEILDIARKNIGQYCKACIECNGKACRNQIPGPGAKGIGDVAIRNYNKWKEIRVNMDTLVENKPIDTSVTIFNHEFRYPFFVGPVGAVNLHYGDMYDDMSYNNIMVSTCAENGILAFCGDGVNPEVIKSAAGAIQNVNGLGIPTIKPWNIEIIKDKLQIIEKAKPIALAMDIDAAGLPFLKNMEPPAGSKSVMEMKEIIGLTNRPFIIKGIMSVKGALKAKEAGATALVVSNHGGRVLDQCPATAEVLADIVQAVGSDMDVFIDGGIRCGADIFKALALGAKGVLIARPFVTALYGGESHGISLYIQQLASELEEVMAMCGAHSLNEITKDMITIL